MRKKFQPLPQGADYFAFFALPQKLSLDLENAGAALSLALLEAAPRSFRASFRTGAPASLDLSSQLNDAYRTLRDPVARVEYLLSLSAMRKEGQKKQTSSARIAGRSCLN